MEASAVEMKHLLAETYLGLLFGEPGQRAWDRGWAYKAAYGGERYLLAVMMTMMEAMKLMNWREIVREPNLP